MKFKQNLRRTALLLAISACTAVMATEAAGIDQLRSTTLKLIDMLVEQGVLTRARADALIKEAQQPSATAAQPGSPSAPAAAATGTVRVPYIPEFVRKELKEEIRQELVTQAKGEGWAGPGSVPAWVRSIKWEGDLRTRYQRDIFADGNAPAVSILDTNRNRALTLLNTSEDRSRFRVRARIGLTATIDPNWTAGVRVTTGSTSDPLSSNQTLGNFNNRYVAALDRAYLRYNYEFGDYAVTASAGRIANPWYGTDLIWANDLSFDALSLRLSPSFGSPARSFIALAAMPVQEVELASGDKWLYGAQAGFEQASRWNSQGGLGYKLGLGYYRYTNMVGKVSPAGSSLLEYTAPQFTQKGNTYFNISSDPARPLLGLASDYRLINFTGSIDYPIFDGTQVLNHIMFTGDYVKNVGFDREAVKKRVGIDVEPKTAGYQVRLAFGRPEIKQIDDWQVFMSYKRLERDAVLDAFTDTDFRLGGTDARGYTVGGSYGLGHNTALNLRYFSADSISGAPLSIDVLQLDLTTRF